jgi:hypothetical protein
VGTREKLFHKHGRHLVLVGGLTDAFFFAPYWELLDSRLGERGWCARTLRTRAVPFEAKYHEVT